MFCTCIREISHPKALLIEEWQKFDQKIIGLAVKQWRPYLKSSASQKGEHFEHQLYSDCLSLIMDYINYVSVLETISSVT